MVAQHLGHAAGQLLRRRQVEETVRAVRVRLGAEHARDDELRGGVAAAQHADERDRPALAHAHDLLAEAGAARGVEPGVEPGGALRRVPAAGALGVLHGHRRAVGRVFRERRDERALRGVGLALAPGGRRTLSLSAVRGRSTLPASRSSGRPSAPVIPERGAPRAVEHGARSCRASRATSRRGTELVVDGVAERGRGFSGLIEALRRDRRVELRELDLARDLSLMRESSWRITRNVDGTTPLSSMPSARPRSASRPRARSAPCPRRLVVHHIWS